MNELEQTAVSNCVASAPPSPEKPLTLEESLRYASALAQALRRMHLDGGVCGALDPDHIVWSPSGAKVEQNGSSALTPYLSPEQLRGEAADMRSDIFAFGAVFYELLAGRRAFPASDPDELRRQILELQPPPIAGIPVEVAALLNRCLEKNPQDRWQRVTYVMLELKLACARARHAQQASEWKDRIAAIGARIAGQDSRFTAYQSAREMAETRLLNAIQTLEDQARQQADLIARAGETLVSVRESVGVLQQATHTNTRAIESVESATVQTDEVLEHVVEAFGAMHRSMVERAEAKVLLVSQNGE
jgi:hypothetical protein